MFKIIIGTILVIIGIFILAFIDISNSIKKFILLMLLGLFLFCSGMLILNSEKQITNKPLITISF